jgi:hypothetical protein
MSGHGFLGEWGKSRFSAKVVLLVDQRPRETGLGLPGELAEAVFLACWVPDPVHPDMKSTRHIPLLVSAWQHWVSARELSSTAIEGFYP